MDENVDLLWKVLDKAIPERKMLHMNQAKLHLLAAAQAELARARRTGVMGPAEGESLLSDMPRWDRLDEQVRDGVDENSGLAVRRELTEKEKEFILAAQASAKIPAFAAFALRSSATGVSAPSGETQETQAAHVALLRLAVPAPPPPATPGGRSLPAITLTPRLLGQRPLNACATRAGCFDLK